MSGQYLKKLVGLGLGLGLVFAAGQADAASYNVASAWIDPSAGALIGTVYNASPAINENAYIGRLLLTGKDSNGADFAFASFCVDIFDNLKAPATFATDTLASLGLSDAQNNQLIKLLANVDTYIGAGASDTDKAERSAAAQMAVWEIVNETGATLDANGGDAARGSFYIYNLNDPVAGQSFSDAATLLSNVQTGGAWANGPATKVALIRAADNQTQIVYGDNAVRVMAVPEPATWGMMVLGFGVLGTALRRKRSGTYAID